MWAWLRTPRGSTTTALVVAVILALLWLDPWTRPLPGRLSFESKPAPEASPPPGVAAGSPPQQGAAPVAKGPAAGNSAASTAPRQQAAAVPEAGGPALSAAGGPAVTIGGQAPQATSLARPSAPPVGGAAPASGTALPGGVDVARTAQEDAHSPAGAPSFDVVRVEPDGSTVIAGRAEPGSEVVLLDGDTPIARAQVDATGQFAILPTLEAGDHALALQTGRGDRAPVKSTQSVAISVAKQAGTRPLVALLSPDKPAEVLSDGGSGQPARPVSGSTPAAAPAVALAIQAVEARQAGQFLASGIARPGSRNRVYLNGSFVAEVVAGQDGRWSVEIQKGMTPGRYAVRADQVETPTGKVVNRAEVPFDYPANAGADNRPTRVAQGGAAQLRDASVRTGQKSKMAPAQPAGPAGQPGGAALAQAGVAPAATLPSNTDGARQAGGMPASPGTGPSAGQQIASAVPPSAPLQGMAAAVVPDLKTTTVARGESLWRISRKLLGRGIRYTEIYASNTAQIRDPALIYPGQVFVLPTQRVN